MVWYPTARMVVDLHAIVMTETGYTPRALMRPEGLESAVLRPQTHAAYEGLDLAGQGVQLAIGIAHAHAFEDGNKRTAFLAMEFFLARNGLMIDSGDDTAGVLLLDVFRAEHGSLARDKATERFVAWVRTHTVPFTID